MRVLHLNLLYPPHVLGGAERSVAFLAEALVRAGHEVGVACLTPGDAEESVRAGVRVWRLPHGASFWGEEWPRHSRLARLKRRIGQQFDTGQAEAFGRVLDSFRPDVVNSHSLVDVSTRCWAEAARRGIPVVHTLRDFDLLCARSTLFRDGRRCAARHPGCRLMRLRAMADSRHVSAVVGIGSDILETHLAHGAFADVPPELRRVIWNTGVVDGDGPPPAPRRREGPLVFGFLGRLTEEKGVRTLIEATRMLDPATVKVVIAGKPVPGDTSFEEAAAGLPIAFVGFRPAAEVLSEIDVLVIPSLWAEPLGRSVLEAYAAGVPALGARSGGIPDLIGPDNDAWLHPPGDAAALADRMRAIIGRGRAGLPGPADFAAVLEATTPERVAAHYADLYAATLDAAARARTGRRAGAGAQPV